MIANTYVVKPFGISEVKVIALKGDPGSPTQEQVNAAVEEYMDDHPEAQIPDGAVTTEKLASNAVAPYADNLVSSSYVSDSEPYLFRKTFAGVREDTEIVGGSLVWNQLEQGRTGSSTAYGITFSYSDGLWTFSGTCTQAYIAIRLSFNYKPIQTGHKILLTNTSSTFKVRLQGTSPSISASTPREIILEAQDGTVNDIAVEGYNMNGVAVNENDSFGIHDLTLMFGPTIADYIYTQEKATAGAGVALAKAWAGITADYYPYDAGSIKSVTGLTSHKMTGFNQWDEEWELGGISNTTGQDTTSTTTIRSKNYIRVLPNVDYYYKTTETVGLRYYDASKSYIGSNTAKNQARTTPGDAYYLRFIVTSTTSYNNDICINLSSSRNGQYEPYTVYSYPLDSSLTLRGLPKLDGDNLYYDGDIYKADGTVERRYALVEFDGSNDEAWNLQSINANNIASFSLSLNNKQNGCGVCNRFMQQNTTIANTTEEGFFLSVNTLYIRISSSKANTVASFRTWLSNNIVTLVYELATPTTESAEPFTNPQVCYPDGTEEYIDTRDVPIPVGHNTKYMRDLKKLLEGIPDAPTASGTYVLKATVSASGVTYSWVAG